MVPVAAVADTVATSPALLKIMARVLLVPLKVLVPVMVCTASEVTRLELPLMQAPAESMRRRSVPPGAKTTVEVKVVVPRKLPMIMFELPVVTQQPALQPRNMLLQAVVFE